MGTHDLDKVALERYLSAILDGFKGPLRYEKFPGGQSNPTFKLLTPGANYVLRRKPPGELLKSAHAVDREFRVMQALQGSEVPVPRVLVLCEDDSVIGSMFYVMEYLDGRVLWESTLPEVESNEERTAIYQDMNRVLAALHSVDIDAVGLSDFGAPGNYYERQVKRWTSQYRASEGDLIPAMETLIEWLPANMPDDDGLTTLVHGDYRLDNLMFHATEPRIIAVLDWELATLGHPLADLAYQIMGWAMPSSLAGVNRDALGIPSNAAYIADYCRRTGRDSIENMNFYMAFCVFRLAAILQGVWKRAVQGNASSPEALERGKMVQPLAEMGLPYIK